MKRLIAFILSVATLFSCMSLFTGCGKGGDKADVVIYKEGMQYTETEKGTPKEFYKTTYDIIGGEDVMPIGGFYAPYASGGSMNGNDAVDFVSEEIFQMINEVGVNVLMYSPDRWGSDTANKSIVKTLDLCEQHNVGYYVDVHWVREQLGTRQQDYPLEDMELNQPGGAEKLSKIIDTISDNGNRKGLIGLMAMDEPFDKALDNMKILFDVFYSLENTRGMDLYLNSLGEWTGTNNFWGYSDPLEYEDYARKFFELNPRMYSITQYPFESANTREEVVTEYLYRTLSTYRRLANEHKVPHWRMLQAGGQFNDRELWIDTLPPYPSEAEMLYDVNVSLAYGSKGIQYFTLIQPQHFAYQTGGTFDYANRNGLIGGDGNRTRWFYYAKRANQQIQAIDEYLMNSASIGIIVHGDTARSYIVNPKSGKGAGEEVFKENTFRQLKKVSGDDCVIGCFDYKGGTALYVVNYNRKAKGKVTLSFDRDDYKYRVIQRAEPIDVVGGTMNLTLDAGEGALIVLD